MCEFEVTIIELWYVNGICINKLKIDYKDVEKRQRNYTNTCGIVEHFVHAPQIYA